MTPSRIAPIAANALITPAAPIVWPTIDLVRADRNLVRVPAEGALDGRGLGHVVEAGARAVRGDVIDLVRRDARRPASPWSSPCTRRGRWARAPRCGTRRRSAPRRSARHGWSRRVRAHARADFDHHDAGALAVHESVAVLVERPRRPLGIVVAPRQRVHVAERRRSRWAAAAPPTRPPARRRRRRAGSSAARQGSR